MSRLDAIRKRLDEATPGPWRAVHRHAGCTANDNETSGLGLEIEGPPEASGRGQFARAADAHLIAHAPEDLRLLLAVADAAVAVIHHGRQHGRECPPDYEDGYPCDGDCDVAFELVRRLDGLLDEVTQEVAV